MRFITTTSMTAFIARKCDLNNPYCGNRMPIVNGLSSRKVYIM